MEKFKYFILILIFITGIRGLTSAEDRPLSEKEKGLSLEEFLQLAAAKDSKFEEILIDELVLQYQKALQLPAKDLVLSVKQQHEFFFDQDRDSPDTTVSLSKLFPYTGTEVIVSYGVGASFSSAEESSEASFGISQPIAQNAFGRSTRLLDKIVGLEVEVARHQVVEAYEDYLAVVLTAYYNWYQDYRNLEVGESSYQSNLKLLDNIYQRKKQNIALPIDVNKVELQVTSKEERLIELREQYKKSLNIINRIIRYQDKIPLVPVEPSLIGSINSDFESCFKKFRKDSRTFDILRKLEEKSGLQVEKDADSLLPSINLLIGYQLKGDDYNINNENNLLYAGLQMDWPLGHQRERAEYEISRILERRTDLSTKNTYDVLYTQLLNLHLQLEKEKKLMEITDKRIELSEAVLEAESENYSFGKVSLNDYIQAVNTLDTNRFNKIFHESLYKKLLVEWLRLTDRLVQYKDVQPHVKELRTGR